MLPEEFKNNMKNLLGDELFHLFEESYSEEAVQALRINPLKKHGDGAADQFHFELQASERGDPACADRLFIQCECGKDMQLCDSAVCGEVDAFFDTAAYGLCE